MDPQFDELAKQIAESVTAAVTKSIETRLDSHFRETQEGVKIQINNLEGRLEDCLAIHFEGVNDQVQRAAEGYGATLESIDRRLDRLETDWNKNFRLHSSVLKNHADRIDVIEKRSGRLQASLLNGRGELVCCAARQVPTAADSPATVVAPTDTAI